MHILIIPSEEYIPKHNPIAGIFQHDQAKILTEKRHQVGVLSFTFNYSISNLLNAIIGRTIKQTKNLHFFTIIKLLFLKTIAPYPSSLTFETIDHINILRCDGFWGLKRTITELSKLEKWINYGDYTLTKYIKKYGKPDVIHAHNMIYAGLLASSIKQKHHIPIVITEHSSEFSMQTIPEELNKEIKSVFKTEDYLFAVGPKLIEQLQIKYPETINKIKWLPNVLDLKIENTPLSLRGNNLSNIRFLNIANLIPLKGQEDLIFAFEKAFKGIENVELIIAGEGPLQKNLTLLIKQNNLTSKIKLIGLINRTEVINQLDNCEVFVLPSHYETFGVVLIEALSRGIPVISTYCGGPECIVKESNGILVEPKNVNQLADALLKMYENYKKYDKTALRNNCLSLYGKETFYKEIMSIYNEAIEKKA